MEAKLYVIPGSHPSRTAMIMLERKGIAYKRVDLMPVISKGALRAAGFPRITVPALARRVLWNALRRDRSPLASYSEGARLGVPIGLAVKTGQPLVALSARLNEATNENVRADLAALPGMLQRIDDWIGDGVLGDEQLNAADLQIGTSVRLLITLQDLREAILARPAGELAMRVCADYPGDTPPILPAAWLEPLRASAATPAG